MERQLAGTKLELLRKSPLLAGLSDADLERLVAQADVITVPAGETLIEQGAPGDSAYVVLSGELEVFIRTGNQQVSVGTRGEGEMIGELALLDQSTRSATVHTVRETHLLQIPQRAFEELLASNASAALSVLKTVLTRLRNRESLLQHQAKMAALGTLSAGLAHELNNPSGAIQRSAAQLREALLEWQRLTKRVYRAAHTAEHAEWLDAVSELGTTSAPSRPPPDPLDLLEQTQRLESWLDSLGIGSAWSLGPGLASAGWDTDKLQESTDHLSQLSIDLSRETFLGWLSSGATVASLSDELRISSARISDIIRAVKSYSHLDQAPVQDVDVHEGLEDTLVILNHKLKDGVTVQRHYAQDLPRLEALAGEINQVWTNLIDNAIDAMHGKGDLTLRTSAHDGRVVVEITDTGPGIPPEAQDRVFEAFFTTKQPGQGTGLGLYIAYNIVVNRHRGSIRFDSEPGRTTFQVVLPLQMKRSD